MAKKTGYRIGEVCRELDLQPYVLRYWETEFAILQPPSGSSGQRSYSEREVEVLRRIKRLLYEEGYTIAGAKKKLDNELAAGFPLGAGEGSLFAGSSAAVVSEAAAAAPESAPASKLDRSQAQQIELLRSGVAKILDEVQALQAVLRSRPERRSR